MGKGWHHCSTGCFRACWAFSVRVCPIYSAIALGCCLGKSCCARVMSWPCFRRLHLTSFIFVHAQLWPRQVRSPVKGSGVIYPQAFTQPLAILGNTWMKEGHSWVVYQSRSPKAEFWESSKPFCSICFALVFSQIRRPTYFRSYQLNVPIKQWPCLFQFWTFKQAPTFYCALVGWGKLLI